jgi:hypothetical protein
MSADTFKDFLEKKNAEEPKIDWDAREKQWIRSVTDFYNNIKKWLKPFIDQKLLVIKEDSWVNIYEHGFGEYDIKKLDIIIGKNDVITLTPRATLVLGNYGRIDMRGPQGVISIIQKNWNEWKFINMSTREELWDADEESFETVIQDLVNG